MSTPTGTEAPRTPGRRTKRPSFDKAQATLWLLTLTLGLGVGTGARVLGAARDASAGTASAQANVATLQPSARALFPTPSASSRVVLLPQRVYSARARSRAS